MQTTRIPAVVQAVLPGFLALAAACACALLFVRHQFGAYDLSPLIDLQWRLSRGETPGADFINTLPLIIPLAIGLVAREPMAWADLTWLNAAATCATFAWLVLASERRLQDRAWLAASAMVISLPLLYTNHIWHSSLSQLAAIVLFHSACRLAEGPLRPGALLALAAAGALTAISKQNIALPALLAVGGWFAAFRRPHGGVCAAVTLAGAAIGVLAAARGLGCSLDDFLYTYRAVRGRAALDLSMWDGIIVARTFAPLMAVTACMAALLAAQSRFHAPAAPAQWLTLAMLGASAGPFLTDWDSKFNDLCLPLFVAVSALLYRPAPPGSPGAVAPAPRGRAATFTLVLAGCVYLLALAGGADRERVRLGGPFYELPESRQIASGYFSGLHTGKVMNGIIEEMHALKRQAPAQSIFFGPRVEFGYMETRSPSPRGLPLWWHPGSSFSIAETEQVAAAFLAREFDILAFSKDDRTRLPPGIVDSIEKFYRPVPGYHFLDVYLRTGATLVPLPGRDRP